MFGMKRVERSVEELRLLVFQMNRMLCAMNHRQEDIQLDVNQKMDLQKIELSRINTRFHGLNEKIEKTHERIDKICEHGMQMNLLDGKLMDKMVSDEAVLKNMAEINQKIDVVFNYMREVEKIMANVDMIIEECLPEKTLRLPKPTTAITELT